MSYIPPELAHDPIEITQRGSIICSCRRLMTGAILIKTVPAMTIRSASRGVPRITSALNRAMSYLLVILVAISTKQHERPKLKGQIEFLRPQASRSCRRVRRRLRRVASSKESEPLVPLPYFIFHMPYFIFHTAYEIWAPNHICPVTCRVFLPLLPQSSAPSRHS